VVTEQGVAPLFGRDQYAQARALIEDAAHPRVRDELWEEAGALGLLPQPGADQHSGNRQGTDRC
jgi:acyl-CoA hydrolase